MRNIFNQNLKPLEIKYCQLVAPEVNINGCGEVYSEGLIDTLLQILRTNNSLLEKDFQKAVVKGRSSFQRSLKILKNCC